MVLAFSGWMDGGDVSTGTVRRLVHLLQAEPFAWIEPDPFYIYNFPGSMEVASLFRPHVEMNEGLMKSIDLPSNEFFYRESHRLAFFVGREPNIRWPTFGNCILTLAEQVGIKRIIFVGSFGGAVPHTREPRLYLSASNKALLEEMAPFDLRPSNYEGPGSFTSYLMNRAGDQDIEMISLVAEIPGYLQGTNPMSIEAVTRRLSKMIHLELNLDELRSASNEWELRVSEAVEKDDELAQQVRELEEAYDNELIGVDSGPGDAEDDEEPDADGET